jgi:uncharacterized protein YdeI (YjbR/CyaY-like superfamily)
MRDETTFFRSPKDFRRWLAANHAKAPELWVGFYKKHSGQPSITWPESVDEALCVGWIDGVRKRLDESRYVIRFTPRKPTSIWSAINIKRVEELAAAGRVRPRGQAAFAKRSEKKSAIYSYEQRTAELAEPYASMLKHNQRAREFFEAQAPSYRKVATWWVNSAKREETRLKRLRQLVEFSAGGRRV